MEREYHCYSRYLAAKKEIDDRSLNRHVWQTLSHQWAQNPPSRILEVGAGIGTMVERVLDWGLLQSADYHTLDHSPQNSAVLHHRLQKRGFLQLTPQLLQQEQFAVHTHTADLFSFLQQGLDGKKWEAIIAHAFLDLFDLEKLLPLLAASLCEGGYFYFTLNFDGITAFEPAIDPPFDALIEQCYHETMDTRLLNGQPSGDSRTGRHLLRRLQAMGATILAAGSSDWVIYADQPGKYSADGDYFLHFIVATIQQALANHPSIPTDRFEQWIEQRHRQIDNGELIYLAHQIDVAAKFN